MAEGLRVKILEVAKAKREALEASRQPKIQESSMEVDEAG
jgi:hypothetical protein